MKKPFLTVKDHAVSGETFQLLPDETMDMLVTHPKPSNADLPKYYQSEDYISHSDSKKSWLDKLYYLVKKYALQRKLKLVEKYVGKGRLLDFGAGTGEFLLAAKSAGWQVTGLEPGQKPKALAQSKGIPMVDDTAEIETDSQDVVALWHVLEHVADLDTKIGEFNRLLSENGVMFIAVPNFKSYDAQHYGDFWAAYDVPRHLWHFSKGAIQQLFAKQGLEVVDIVPMPFDSFYIALLSEKYRSGKQHLFKAFYIGCLSNWKARKSKEYSSLIYVIKPKKSV